MKQIALSLTVSIVTLLVSIAMLYNPPSPLLKYWLASAAEQGAPVPELAGLQQVFAQDCSVNDKPVAIMLDTQAANTQLLVLEQSQMFRSLPTTLASDCNSQSVISANTGKLLGLTDKFPAQQGKFIVVFHPELKNVLVFEMSSTQQQLHGLGKPGNSSTIVEM